jgi:hypothetical protein
LEHPALAALKDWYDDNVPAPEQQPDKRVSAENEIRSQTTL